MDSEAKEAVWQRVQGSVRELIQALHLDPTFESTVRDVYLDLCGRLAADSRTGPLVMGVNGAPGSGKTTFTRFALCLFELGFGKRTVTFSIDDFYLTRAERRELAQTVHPLLATRGVPGTHDMALLRGVMHGLKTAGAHDLTRIPVFDKAEDDRLPESDFIHYRGQPDLILFEGWCVGATPWRDEALTPINDLERTLDPDGVWRRYMHGVLTEHRELFQGYDLLIHLKSPDFESVLRRRMLQEHKLRAKNPNRPGLMSDEAVKHFLAHFERLIRHMWAHVNQTADILIDPGAENPVTYL